MNEKPITFDNLTPTILWKILDNQPEVIVIGTAELHKIMDIALVKHLNDKGIAIEAMASRQTCHTYEVMAHEEQIQTANICLISHKINQQ